MKQCLAVIAPDGTLFALLEISKKDSQPWMSAALNGDYRRFGGGSAKVFRDQFRRMCHKCTFEVWRTTEPITVSDS